METGEGNIVIMSEGELAKQIEAMRDDAEAWGEPVAEPERKRKSERRQRGAMVSVRFSPDELAAVQEHAADVGMPVSGYLRDLALKAASQPIVIMGWSGAAAINASATEERLLLRDEQICA
jgi:predicted DNA binding CopG/RHH family protein